MKKLSIIFKYYNQKQILKEHIEKYNSFPEDILKHVKFIIIDDGSSNKPELPNNHLDIEIYRIEEDLYWNIPGCFNLGSHVCNTPWMFHTDMDHFLTLEALKKMLKLIEKDENKIFKFKRRNIKNNKTKIHPGSMLLKKEIYWDVGGCDEDFTGAYGFIDTQFFYRAEKKYQKKDITDVELLLDTRGETKEMIRDRSKNEKLLNDKKKKENWSKDFFRFNWHRVI